MQKSPPPQDVAKLPVWAGLLALAVILFLFGSYELVERVWLADADDHLVRFLHLVRGMGISLIVAFLVTWYILRYAPSMFPAEHAVEANSLDNASLKETRLEHFGNWFILMRWVVCLVALLLVFMTIGVTKYLTAEVLWPLLGLISFLAASNFFFLLCLRRGWLPSHLLELQIASDLILLTAMLHFSGGIENPLYFLYFFHIIISGIILSRKQCYLVAFTGMLLFGGMAALELAELINHYTLLTTPHNEVGGEIFHLAHQPVYVISTVVLQAMFMLFTAHFTTTIMERLRNEERGALTERQRLERVVESTNAGLVVLDHDLQTVWLNERIRQWLTLPPHKKNLPALPESWTGGKTGSTASTLQDGQIRTVERQLAVDGEGIRFFQVTIAPLLNDRGEIFQVVELAQDITQQKIVAAEMMHASKMAGLGVMAAGIAHEVGNPLASLTTRLRLLEDSTDTNYLKESIPILREQIHRIDRIVRGVSQFARKSEMNWQVCDIKALLGEVVGMLRLHGAAKQSRIELSFAKVLAPTMGVRDQLFQVFLNLGINALQAMPDGGVLKIIVSANEEHVLVAFADCGEGMSENSRKRAFQPFYSTKPSGLGLGLSIVQNIINAHGGQIKVEANKEKGTRFIVLLPVKIGGKEEKFDREKKILFD